MSYCALYGFLSHEQTVLRENLLDKRFTLHCRRASCHSRLVVESSLRFGHTFLGWIVMGGNEGNVYADTWDLSINWSGGASENGEWP